MNIIKTGLKFSSGLTKRNRTTHIVLHHASASKCNVNDVHRWHTEKGWSGIGYHFFVDKNGHIYEGRPLDTIGAHCSGHNQSTIGICAEGQIETETMTASQKKAIAELLNYVQGVYPKAVIVGHRELKPTACPGKNYPLSELKDYKTILEGDDVNEVKKSLEKIEEELKSLKNCNKVYRSLQDVPSWYRPTVDTLIEKGGLQGTGNGELNVSEDLCRTLTVLHRLGLF